MSNIDILMRQHFELKEYAGRLTDMLTEQKLKTKAQEARSLLAGMSGKLKIHIAMEDKVVYPHLLDHHESSVRDLARKYMDEMGGLSVAFREYLDRWPTHTFIEKDPAGFIRETKGILDALGKRIEREDGELYLLASKYAAAEV